MQKLWNYDRRGGCELCGLRTQADAQNETDNIKLNNLGLSLVICNKLRLKYPSN